MTVLIPFHVHKWLLEPLTKLLPESVKAMFFGIPVLQTFTFREDVRSVSVGHRCTIIPTEQLFRGTLSEEAPKNQTIDIVLPKSCFLERVITAPSSAKKSLHAVAQLDLQRKTPFQSSDVIWALGNPEHNETDIRVTQWLAKKSDITHWKARLYQRGLSIRRIYIEGAEISVPIADFSNETMPSAGRWRLVNGGLLATAACLLVFLWLYPAWAIRPQIKQLDLKILSLQAEALELRKDVDTLREYQTEKAAFLDIIRHRTLLSEALREMTVILPDTVWLETMVFQAGTLVINGEAAGSAPELVLALSKNTHFRNPRLTGAVSSTSSGAERFEITMEADGL